MSCPECDGPFVAVAAAKLRDGQVVPITWSTLVAYFGPDNHKHDDNCMTRTYLCALNHETIVSIVRTCPACDWKGKRECPSCHPGRPKLDAWPENCEMLLERPVQR